METKTLKQMTCKRCGYKWFSTLIGELPKSCSHCKSTLWNTDYAVKKTKLEEASHEASQNEI